MTDIIDSTLYLWRSTPFVWGEADCLLSVGDYIAARGGYDVTGLFRGTYGDEAGAMAYVGRYGGVEGLIDLAGVPRVPDDREAVRGDVVALDTGGVIVGALCTGPGIAARLERGVIEVDRRFVRIAGAWEVSKLCRL